MTQGDYERTLRNETILAYVVNFGFIGFLYIALIILIQTDFPENAGPNGLILNAIAIIIYPTIYFFIYGGTRTINFRPLKTTKDVFSKVGFEKLVIRYRIQEKFVTRFIVIFIIMIIFLVLVLPSNSELDHGAYNAFGIMNFTIIPGTMVYTLIWFRFRLSRHIDFGYWFAVGCFRIAINLESPYETVKAKYTVLGLKAYDNYLRKTIKVRISNLERIYSKIISQPAESMDDSIGTIQKALESEQELGVLRYLAKLVGESAIDSILIPDSVTKKIEGQMPTIIAIITTIVAIVAVWIESTKPPSS